MLSLCKSRTYNYELWTIHNNIKGTDIGRHKRLMLIKVNKFPLYKFSLRRWFNLKKFSKIWFKIFSTTVFFTRLIFDRWFALWDANSVDSNFLLKFNIDLWEEFVVVLEFYQEKTYRVVKQSWKTICENLFVAKTLIL